MKKTIRRDLIVRGALTLILFAVGVSVASSSGTDTSTAVTATADAYVSAASPSENEGTNVKLRADGSPSVTSYLRFALPAPTASVSRVTLSLHALSDLPSGIEVHSVTGPWDESSLTGANAPAVGTLVGTSGAISAGNWVDVDVTSAASAGGTVSFAVTDPSTRAVAFDSRESANPPRLVVQTGTGGSTSTVTPAGTTTGTTTTTTTSTGTTTTTPVTTTAPVTTTTPSSSQSTPIRAAFYYPWFPSAWNQQGMSPFTHYHPTLGYYDGAATSVITQQMRWLQSAGMNAVIASWWGPGSNTDLKIPTILSTLHSMGSPLKLSLYYEIGSGLPATSQITSDLDYIYSHYASDSSFLRVGGKPVLFVYNAGNGASCTAPSAFKTASAGRFYVDLKVFTGFKNCADQPEGWHQYGPAVAESWQKGYSFTISPGFYKANESTARLARDPARWTQNVKDMAASGERWQLVTTFNEWGEGTSVEPATEWASASGMGVYLDTLRSVLGGSTPPPSPPTPTTTSTPTTTTTTTTTTPAPVTTTTASSGSDPVIAAAGDIACNATSSSFNNGTGTKTACRQKWTSDLLSGMANLKAVLPLGDVQYECGDAADFAASYDPSWGRFKSITHWATGNHEYGRSCGRNDNSVASQYFGVSNPKGWYSYDVGAWHMIALNSECSYGTGATAVGGCGAGSPQETWLKQDLAAHPNQCTLAYWHEPRFSSGEHGDATQMSTIWNDLVAAHVDVALWGHNHDYERFDPIGTTPAPASSSSPVFQDPVLDPNGIRAFVVGTGGKNHYGFGTQAALKGEVVRDSTTYGVLKLTLHPTSYDWQFVNDPGSGSFTDSGSGTCH